MDRDTWDKYPDDDYLFCLLRRQRTELEKELEVVGSNKENDDKSTASSCSSTISELEKERKTVLQN